MVKIDVGRFSYGLASFYKMQLLHITVQNLFILWTRWGRIGDQGQYQRTPFKTIEEAKKEFHKVFKQKTGNDWNKVGEYEKKERKFELKEVDGKPIAKSGKAIKFSSRNLDLKGLLKPINFEKAKESKLPPELKELFSDVIDTKLLDGQLRKVTKLSNDLVLTSVDYSTIEEAQKTLANLEDYRKKCDKLQNDKTSLEEYKDTLKEMYQLSNKYYELLAPTGYAYESIKPILSQKKIQKEKDKLSDLIDLEIAFKIILGAKLQKKEIHPFDYCIQSLNVNLDVLSPVKYPEEHGLITRYINLPYDKRFKLGYSCNNYLDPQKYCIKNVLKVTPKATESAEEKEIFETLHNHTMLWHGTSTKNLLGILSQGLRIAPFSAALTGSLFGKGIYFADSFEKSFVYAKKEDDNQFVLLLCEVALGNVFPLPYFNTDALPPENYHSFKSLPESGPSLFVTSPEGIVYPIGNMVKYDKPHIRANGNKYYRFNDYKDERKKHKKEKVGLELVKKKKKVEDEEDEKEYLNPVNERGEQSFLKPEFKDFTIPTSNLQPAKDWSTARATSEYVIFNGAQARIRYVVVMETIKNEDFKKVKLREQSDDE